MKRSLLLGALLLCVLGAPSILLGDAVTINFEGLPDSTVVTNQYPGLTFSNAIILTAGISLNEFEFPPHSGVNVVSDNGGPMSVMFASPIVSFGASFTYLEPLTLDGFNASNALVATATSAFSTNDALYGDPGSSPNEFLGLAFAGGISDITITGDPLGSSFVMDDMTYTTTSVPEPAPFLLCLTVFAALTLVHARKRRKGLIRT